MANTGLIRCTVCGAMNRVLPGRATALCGRCHESLAVGGGGGGGASAPTGTAPVHLTDANFDAEVIRADQPVLVDFWAAWCGPCRMVAPIVEQIAMEYAGRLKVGKLDTDSSRQVATAMRITSLPTLGLFQGGREIDRLIGARPADQIRAWLSKHGIR